jgi:hypothetical protein
MLSAKHSREFGTGRGNVKTLNFQTETLRDRRSGASRPWRPLPNGVWASHSNTDEIRGLTPPARFGAPAIARNPDAVGAFVAPEPRFRKYVA